LEILGYSNPNRKFPDIRSFSGSDNPIINLYFYLKYPFNSNYFCRSSINVILRRLDKTIVKIAKRPSMRRSAANWEAVSCWLAGLYQTLLHSPHIAHLHSLKVNKLILTEIYF